MYLEIRHKNNGFHTTQMFPSGNYDMGKGNTYAAHLWSQAPKQWRGKGCKNKTFPYDTSIHRDFGELETQTRP